MINRGCLELATSSIGHLWLLKRSAVDTESFHLAGAHKTFEDLIVKVSPKEEQRNTWPYCIYIPFPPLHTQGRKRNIFQRGKKFFPAWNAFSWQKIPILIDPKQISVVLKSEKNKKKKKKKKKKRSSPHFLIFPPSIFNFPQSLFQFSFFSSPFSLFSLPLFSR